MCIVDLSETALKEGRQASLSELGATQYRDGLSKSLLDAGGFHGDNLETPKCSRHSCVPFWVLW